MLKFLAYKRRLLEVFQSRWLFNSFHYRGDICTIETIESTVETIHVADVGKRIVIAWVSRIVVTVKTIFSVPNITASCPREVWCERDKKQVERPS